MAAINGHFCRGTDPYFFLYWYQLAMWQVSCFYHKMHDSSQNCYISAPLTGIQTVILSELMQYAKNLGGKSQTTLELFFSLNQRLSS